MKVSDFAALRPYIVIDGNNILHRAFHGQPVHGSPRGPHGMPLNAIRGLVSAFRDVLSVLKPRGFFVVLDGAGPSIRDLVYSEYKAQRRNKAGNRDLSRQLEYALEVCTMLGVPAYQVPNWEADDLVASMVWVLMRYGPVGIYSTDLDFCSLVGPSVTLVRPLQARTYELCDPDYVVERFGVPSIQFPLYKALVGDQTDHIPGVPGVGPKTAEKWLAGGALSTPQLLLQAANGTVPGLAKKIEEDPQVAANLFRDEFLATLHPYAPMMSSAEDYGVHPVTQEGWDLINNLRLTGMAGQVTPGKTLVEAFCGLQQV